MSGNVATANGKDVNPHRRVQSPELAIEGLSVSLFSVALHELVGVAGGGAWSGMVGSVRSLCPFSASTSAITDLMFFGELFGVLAGEAFIDDFGELAGVLAGERLESSSGECRFLKL